MARVPEIRRGRDLQSLIYVPETKAPMAHYFALQNFTLEFPAVFTLVFFRPKSAPSQGASLLSLLLVSSCNWTTNANDR